ncbi:MAG: class I SAM-dependent methyltransferase [Actinomycetota bacterium]|nr:class I SAM-dependent methyltransferase [Actinomycetota bacterium]
MTTSLIRQTLRDIGAIHDEDVATFRTRTRDREVPVYRDQRSGVIFIDDFYVGDDEYVTGEYRGPLVPSYEDAVDTERRVVDFRDVYYGRSILDFGCGEGNFLRAVAPSAAAVCGIELQESYRDRLTADGIACFAGLDDGPKGLDAAFMFHVLEHLPEPLGVLDAIRDLLVPGSGRLVVEVPHARDLLLSMLHNDAFTSFTLWSQHLVLHTRDSLTRLLTAAGYTDLVIEGVQRYGLANHLTWLAHGKPGGHRGELARLQTAELASAYAAALSAVDATDTLVVTATARR